MIKSFWDGNETGTTLVAPLHSVYSMEKLVSCNIPMCYYCLSFNHVSS